MKEKLVHIVLPLLGGIALSIIVGMLLTDVVSEPVRQGLAFWVLMLSQYPVMNYLNRKNNPVARPLRFSVHLVVASIGALLVGALSTVL